MNDDSEALQRDLLELLRDLTDFTTSDDSGVVNRDLGWRGESLGEDVSTSPNLFISQDADSVTTGHLENTPLVKRRNLLKLGETPAVKDRFHTLLKHRLQSEIQRNPPLFPWETELHDYETSAATVWMSQLKTLSLPIPVPDTILSQLLKRCQEAVNSSLLEGAKLVKAVEELFPDQTQALNHLAGMVMTSPARSGINAAPQPGTNYPLSYEAAGQAQQMVLSLLAAREIIAALTLTVSPSQPQLERQWLTELGALRLQVDYGLDATASRLRIQATLPQGGSIVLRDQDLQASAQRATPGSLSVELFDLQPQQSCSLEVCLSDQEPLNFVVNIAAA